MKHIRTFLRKKKKKFKNIIYHSPNPTRTHAHPTSLISERLQLPRDKDNWKQKWRAKSKNFISKQNTGSLSLSLSLSLTARARACPWEKWRRKLRRSQYGRRWSRCDWRAKERYRSTSRRSTLMRRRFAIPSNPSSPELNKPPKTKVCFTMMCFFFVFFCFSVSSSFLQN